MRRGWSRGERGGGSEFAAEGAVLAGGEEGVELRQRHALRRRELLHRGQSVGSPHQLGLRINKQRFDPLRLGFARLTRANLSSPASFARPSLVLASSL